jgi:serine/threonine-protein kinase
MATVYKATLQSTADALLGQQVDATTVQPSHRLLALAPEKVRTLKVFRSELFFDEGQMRMFKHDLSATRMPQHPNLVRVDDVDEAEDGRPFIVMEFIQGQNLRDIIRSEGPLAVSRVCTITKQVAAALDAGHRLGLIHGDMKPDQIVLVDTPDLEMVKLLNFGLLPTLGAHRGEGIGLGTPPYMSPEQAMGKKHGYELDRRTDIYSVGVVMYQMLTKDLPFKADAPTGFILAHIKKLPTPIREAHPELKVPEALAGLVMRCLEKNRDCGRRTPGS